MGLTAALRKLHTRLSELRWRLSREEGRRRRMVIQHAWSQTRPTAAGGFVPDKVPTTEDVAIAGRLLAAFRAASEDEEGAPIEDPAAVWTQISRRQHRFASILGRGDAEELAAHLCNVSRQDASEGITQGEAEYERLVRDRFYRSYVLLSAKDKLVSLAEAVGARAVENPEQGPFGAALHEDPTELVTRIGERLGVAIAPPDVDGGLLKLRTGRGQFGERDLNAIYTAWLLSSLSASRAATRVCEIGGGSGRVAYWSHQLGLRAYTIVDLPRTNVVQGYYALKSIPGNRVSLYGERETDGLRILPARAIADIREPTYDLVLNQDSFPEMSPETVADYLAWIRTCCSGRLVSINHESKPSRGDGVSQVSVPESIEKLGGFSLEQRFPYWLRRGYVLEVYRVQA